VNKSIIVTGAGAGIGESIARLAAERGYRVGVLDIDGAAAHSVADSISGAVALEAAVTDPAQVEAALETFGTPDVLVNNAGIVRFGPLLDQTVEDWRAAVDVNLTGMFICSTACARRMAQAGGGSIVSITSINGIAPGPNAGAYGASKAAINMLSQQMSIEWGPMGVRVNTVAPGLIDGGMSAPIFADPDFRRRRTQKVPSGRLGTVEDIAKAVLYLCSEDADYITGHQLVVDGGVINSIIANLPRPESVDGVGASDDN
jgi:NAD(P)-dependent dehydrogenase (short-subunit alcohol dehydrogenase family)